jgi:sulfopyruvate decarboxylase alpha subunit
LSHVLRELEAQYPDVRLLLATREEEAFGIAAGLYLGGLKPTVMLQSSGLGNSLNALTSLLLPYQIPALIVVSMRGDAGEWNAAQVPMGRAVRSIFDAIGVPHSTVESAAAAKETVYLAGRTAFGTRTLGACLLPRRVTASDPGARPGSDGGQTGVRPRSGPGSEGGQTGVRPRSGPGSDPRGTHS